MDLVTVITANYNGSRFLQKAVESVLAQSYQHVEYIIVDDGSTDDSVRLINTLAKQNSCIKPIFLPKNVGVAEARNEGIKQSSGKYIAFIDADDLWDKEKIAAQLKVFAEHPKAGLVVTAAQVINDSGKHITCKKSPSRRVNIKEGNVTLFDYVSGKIPVSINTMTKRECIEKVGMFNPNYVIGEDYELWMRIIRHYEYFYIDEPLHLYRLHDNNATKDKIFNRQSKLKILEEMIEKDPHLIEELGKGFQVILQRKHNALGRIYYEKGQYNNARKSFSKASNVNGCSIQKLKAQLWKILLKIRSH